VPELAVPWLAGPLVAAVAGLGVVGVVGAPGVAAPVVAGAGLGVVELVGVPAVAVTGLGVVELVGGTAGLDRAGTVPAPVVAGVVVVSVPGLLVASGSWRGAIGSGIGAGRAGIIGTVIRSLIPPGMVPCVPPEPVGPLPWVGWPVPDDWCWEAGGPTTTFVSGNCP
jgi:hypothetical protein